MPNGRQTAIASRIAAVTKKTLRSPAGAHRARRTSSSTALGRVVSKSMSFAQF